MEHFKTSQAAVIVTPKYKFPTPELKTGAQYEASIIKADGV